MLCWLEQTGGFFEPLVHSFVSPVTTSARDQVGGTMGWVVLETCIVDVFLSLSLFIRVVRRDLYGEGFCGELTAARA